MMRKRLIVLMLICSMIVSCGMSASASVFMKESENGMVSAESLTSGDIYVYPEKTSSVKPTAKLMSSNDDNELPPAISHPGNIKHIAANALDGDMSTIARAGMAWVWTLEIDLNKTEVVDNLKVIFTENGYPISYIIETSVDRNIWDFATEDDDNDRGGEFAFEFDPRNARYIRIRDRVEQKNVRQMEICEVELGKESISQKGGILAAGLYNTRENKMLDIEIKEIAPGTTPEEIFVKLSIDGEVTGLPESEVEPVNLATGATGKLLGNAGNELVASNGRIAEYALDGNKTTGACAGGEWAWTFQAELTEIKSIGMVSLLFSDIGYPIAFDILTSEDGENWTVAKKIEDNSTGGLHEISLDNKVNAKFVRIRDNIAQTGIRQMVINEFELYENNGKSDYEVRAFTMTDTETYMPFYNDVYVLNGGVTSLTEAETDECLATLNADGELRLLWDAEKSDGKTPLLVRVSKNGELIYLCAFSAEEALSEALIMNLDGLSIGDSISVNYTGAYTYTKEIIYDKSIIFSDFADELENCNEVGIMDILMKYPQYIVSECMDEADSFSEEEKTAVEAAIINTTFESFEELNDLLDSEYAKILNEREQAKKPAKKPTSSGGGGGGKTGGGASVSIPKVEVEKFEEPVKEITETGKDEFRFADLEGFSWAEESIYTLYQKNIIAGTGGNFFEPGRGVSRREFVKMLTLAFGIETEGAKCEFNDVSPESWEYPYIAAAYEAGLVNGISKTEFGAAEPITRQDATVMLFRFCQNSGIVLKISAPAEFSDNAEIAGYAAEAVEVISSAGIINGMNGEFVPYGICNRAMAAKMICNAMERR